MRVIIFNTEYFKTIILKLKTYIYSSNSEIIYSFSMCEGYNRYLRGKNFLTFIFLEKNALKYTKTIVEPYVYENLKPN